MKPPTPNRTDWNLVKNSALYKQLTEEKSEVLKHKWIESEKVGHDIGFEKALLNWKIHHKPKWDAAQKEVKK
jgi:hypothetical protein